MAKWSRVSVAFDASDETLNFGTRAIAVSERGVFASATLAEILADSSDLVNENPICHALYSPENGVLVGLDCSLVSFTPSFTEIRFTSHFNATIESVEVTQDGELIICGLSNGILICLKAKRSGQILFSKPVDITSDPEGIHFSKISSKGTDGCFEIYICLTNGAVIRAYHEDVTQFLNNDTDISSKIMLTVVKPPVPYCTNSIASPIFEYEQDVLITLAKRSFELWSIDGEILSQLLVEDLNFKRIVYSPNSDHIICLDDDGYLVIFSPHSFCIIKKWDAEKVKDFALLNSPMESNKIVTEVIILTASEVCLLEIPVMEVKLRLKVSTETYLVHNQLSSEDILYAEGHGPGGRVDTLRVKAITESTPEERLERLLYRCKFAEAEKFARSVELDLEVVHKAKVRWLMNKLPLKKIPEESEAILRELMSLLEKIEDILFIADCCLGAFAPDLKMIQQLYDYGLKKLRLCQNGNPAILSWLNKFSESIITLKTFILINEDDNSTENWQIFSKSNPIMVCKNFLLKGEINRALIVCQRHFDQIRSVIPTGLALELLYKIPPFVPTDALLAWLRVYLSVLLATHPHLLNEVVIWAVNRTKSLEVEERSDWLERGLHFVRNVIKTFEEVSVEECYAYSPLTLSPLHTLARHLDRLLCLQTDYCFDIEFQEYLDTIENQNGQAMLLFLILGNISQEKMSDFIRGFFSAHCARYHLERDLILASSVAKLVEQYKNSVGIETAWETRGWVIIRLIQTIQYRMEATVTLLNHASVPWSKPIQALAQDAQKVEHPLAKEVYLISKDVSRKLIEKKYGIPHDSNFKIFYFIQHIYLHGEEESKLSDAEKLVEGVDSEVEKALPYSIHLLNAAKSGCVEEVLHSLRSKLKEDQLALVIQTLINTLQHRLIQEAGSIMKSNPVLFTAFSVLNPREAAELLSDIQLLQNTWKIREITKRRNLSLTSAYLPKSKREDLLREHLRSFFLEKKDDKTWLDRMVIDAGEVAASLNFPRELGHLEMSFIFASCENPLLSRLVLLYEDDFYSTYTGRILDLFALLLDKAGGGLKLNDALWDDIQTALIKTSLCLNGRVHQSRRCVELLRLTNLLSSQTKVVSKLNNVEGPLMSVPASVSKKFLNAHVPGPSSSLITIRHDIEVVFQSVSNVSSIPRMQAILWKMFVEEEDSTDLGNLKEIASQRVLQVLGRVVRSQNLNVNLSLALLGLVPHEIAMTWLHRRSSFRLENSGNLKYESAVALVGHHYVKRMMEPTKSFAESYSKYDCFQKLQLYRISPKVASLYSETYEQKIALFSGLLKAFDVVNMSLLRNLCEGLNFNFQHCLKLFLEQILLTWEPLYEEKVNQETKEIEIKILSKKEDLERKCSIIQALYDNKEDLAEFLNGIFPKVNFYCYEVFAVIIDTMLDLLPEPQELYSLRGCLLNFLMFYKRVGWTVSRHWKLPSFRPPYCELLQGWLKIEEAHHMVAESSTISNALTRSNPEDEDTIIDSDRGSLRQQALLLFQDNLMFKCSVSSEETEMWMQNFPDVTSIPSISKYRLPFVHLENPLKTIQPELTLKTYRTWLDAPSWLYHKFERDLICLYTIMNLKGNTFNNAEWNLHLEHKALSDELTECIDKMENYEYAVAASYCVVNQIMPPGADRFDAALRCLRKAELWLSAENNEKSRIGYAKAKNKYMTVLTYHYLHKFGLGKPEYLGVSRHLGTLFTVLYQDQSILAWESDLTTSMPDVNSAVKRIAEAHEFELSGFLLELIGMWLEADSTPPNSSLKTIDISPPSPHHPENVSRASYVLFGFKDIPVLPSYLARIAFFPEESHSQPPGVRYNALLCLQTALSPSELRTLSGFDEASIRDLKTSLEFISELEHYSMEYSVTAFNASDKEEIVKILLNMSSPSTIALAARLSIIYRVNSTDIWDNIISLMSLHTMIKMLEFCLPKIRHLTNSIDKSGLKSAWEVLISNTISLLRLKNQTDGDFDSEIRKSFNLIQKCPLCLDLNEVISFYREMGYSNFGETLAKLL